MTKSAGVEYAPRGIRINAVCPGTIDTPMVADMLEGQADAMAEIMKQQSIGRLGRAEEVAAAVLWLCSPAASFVDWCRPAGRRRIHRALRTTPMDMPTLRVCACSILPHGGETMKVALLSLSLLAACTTPGFAQATSEVGQPVDGSRIERSQAKQRALFGDVPSTTQPELVQVRVRVQPM